MRKDTSQRLKTSKTNEWEEKTACCGLGVAPLARVDGVGAVQALGLTVSSIAPAVRASGIPYPARDAVLTLPDAVRLVLRAGPVSSSPALALRLARIKLPRDQLLLPRRIQLLTAADEP
ncbi:hypothetical protein FB451DRAFT_1400328 [Mycena latifolia]|nr:hypothetical protein FB451DRAFT_1400328 [Mycena latifolia]